jgi:hypothetical protein
VRVVQQKVGADGEFALAYPMPALQRDQRIGVTTRRFFLSRNMDSWHHAKLLSDLRGDF